MAETHHITRQIKMLKELDEQVIDILSASKDEDEQVGREIEDSDKSIAELERTLLQLDDVLGKLGGSLLLLTPINDICSAAGRHKQCVCQWHIISVKFH